MKGFLHGREEHPVPQDPLAVQVILTQRARRNGR
jgi:hypothetical protein